MDDSSIVELYWRRDQNAISETAARYHTYCYAIAYRILYDPEEAEESVNDAYLAAWNSMPPHRPAMLSTYLGKLTRYISLKKWRDKRAQKRGGGETALAFDELAECVPDNRSIDAALEARELASLLNRFLAALPVTERRVFVCRYWYLDPIADIGKQFGFSKSKVKSMLYRIRGKLLLTLKKEGVFDEIG